MRLLKHPLDNTGALFRTREKNAVTYVEYLPCLCFFQKVWCSLRYHGVTLRVCWCAYNASWITNPPNHPQSTTHPFIPKTFIEWLLWPKWWGYNHEKNKRWVPGFHASHSNWSIDISWRERRNSYMIQCLIAVNITKSNGVWGMVERDMELLLFLDSVLLEILFCPFF